MLFRSLSGASKTERLAARACFIPKNAEPIHECDELAVYRYPFSTARTGVGYGVMTFYGSAGKPTTHYSYRNLEKANAAIVEALDALALRRVELWRKAREKKAWVNPLTVGTILYTSWGYDQTNVEFYIVTRVSGRRTWIREIAGDSESTGYDQGRCWPAVPVRMVGEETMHTAQPCGTNDKSASIKITDCQRAWVESGQTHHFSSGH